jgi:hypothetical protein
MYNYNLLTGFVNAQNDRKIKEIYHFCKIILLFACNMIIIMYLCSQFKHKLKYGTNH